ncbi:hypothetical protein [Haloferula sp. BvORR071]|uniref:hypothetical protein n=1 Tax=Haloferula sp. BvORR071 TaxID=1396141 RepID=UPI000553167E|nr:hypothetical protein [Haloferula sp. BvORR071]
MKTLASILALGLSAVAAHADQARTVEASFYCFKNVPGAETIQILGGSAPASVRLSAANISNSVPLTVNGELAIIGRTGSTEPAAKVKIPASLRKALVVLLPAPAGSSEAYQAFAIDYSRENFRKGTYRLVNISRHAVRGAIGRSYAEVKSGGTGDIELQGDEGATQGAKFEFNDKGAWNRLTETRCAVRRDRRWLVVVHEDPVTQRMNLRSIPDRESQGTSTQTIATADTGE